MFCDGFSLESVDEYVSKCGSIGEKALVIGGGPSGSDIVAHLAKTAERVTYSQHRRPNETKAAREKRESVLPPKATLQDNVKRFTKTGAEFIDGSHETFTVVIFATGESR